LHDRKELLAGVRRRAGRDGEVAAELALEDAVEPLELLLLAEADAVLAGLRPAVAVHARQHALPAVESTLGVALRAFEEELHPLAAAELANGIGGSRHRVVVRNEFGSRRFAEAFPRFCEASRTEDRV